MDLERIGQLTDAQVEDLYRLYQNEWWTRRRTMKQTRRLLKHSSLVVGFCVPTSGRLVAFARVLTDFTIKALVLDVIVDQEFRGTGLGRKLMNAVVSHPELEHVLNLELYCRPPLVPFYEQWDFAELYPEMRSMRLNREKA